MDNDGRLIVRDDCVKPKQQRNSSDPVSDTRSLTSSRMSRKSLLSSQRKRQKTESGWSYTGVEYTSKKAGGDLRKKGKLEPYAYWPLDRKLLNRRVDRKAVARKGMASVMVRKDLKRLEGKSASRALAVTPKRRRGKK
ncbi:RRP12-like protein [Dendrobium catenatum]|nr:RRP12-like protein [Dendrobium catenatum]